MSSKDKMGDRHRSAGAWMRRLSISSHNQPHLQQALRLSLLSTIRR
jgi:hypothetical protein